MSATTPPPETTLPSPAEWTQRLALGTVQFGLDYGISNTAGQVDQRAACAILNLAANAGIDTLDTAAAYGNSEAVIGHCLAPGDARFAIVSKLPPDADPAAISGLIRHRLERLGVSRIKGCLAHSFDSFQRDGVRQQLRQARAAGLVQAIGVSVYFPREVEWLLERDLDVDIVQLPFNVLDQRFAPLFAPLRERGIEVHARSVFLQGLFFVADDQLPARFEPVKPTLAALRRVADEAGLGLADLLLNFAVAEPGIDKVVIGTTGVDQLQHNLDSHRHYRRCLNYRDDIANLVCHDEQIILPFNWT